MGPVSLAIIILPPAEVLVVASTELPASWLPAPVSGVAVPIEAKEFERAAPIVRRELKRYSTKVLSQLARVQLVKSINFFGQPYGGTNSNDTVFLSVDGIDKGFTDLYLSGCVHHEFSSILLRNFPSNLDQSAWKKGLPIGFSYHSSGVDAIANGKANTSVDAALAQIGFLSQYSQSAQEEDFNIIVQNLFVGGKEFWTLVDKYPKTAAKVRLVISFYQKLDAALNESSFRKFNR